MPFIASLLWPRMLHLSNRWVCKRVNRTCKASEFACMQNLTTVFQTPVNCKNDSQLQLTAPPVTMQKRWQAAVSRPSYRLVCFFAHCASKRAHLRTRKKTRMAPVRNGFSVYNRTVTLLRYNQTCQTVISSCFKPSTIWSSKSVTQQ